MRLDHHALDSPMRYCAFIRAINLGKHNRIRMGDLRAIFECRGAREPRTYLQSGNVLFECDVDTAALAAGVESDLAGCGLVRTPVVLRSLPELEEIAGADPFAALPAEGYVRTVVLLRDPWPPAASAAVPTLPGVVALRERELLLGTPTGQAANSVFAPIERKYGVQGTARYWHVVQEVTRLLREG